MSEPAAPAIARKVRGPSVSIYIDGTGGNSEISVSCDFECAEEYRCPFALAPEMPMKPGARCAFRDFSNCPKPAARLAALERAAGILSRRIKAEREEVEQ